MTIVFDSFPQMQARLEEINQELNRGEGAQTEILRTIKKDFGCKTIEAAEREHEKLKEERQAAADKYFKKMKLVKKKYPQLLKEK